MTTSVCKISKDNLQVSTQGYEKPVQKHQVSLLEHPSEPLVGQNESFPTKCGSKTKSAIQPKEDLGVRSTFNNVNTDNYDIYATIYNHYNLK